MTYHSANEPSGEKRSLTALEHEKARARLRGETEELVDAVGSEHEAMGVKSAQEVHQKETKAQQAELNRDQELLVMYSNNKKNYWRYLTEVVQRFLREERIPKKYHIMIDQTDLGITVGLEGTDLLGAFKVSGVPFYDINACKILAVQTGNTIAKMEGHFKKSPGGVILAEQHDLAIVTGTYGRPRKP